MCENSSDTEESKTAIFTGRIVAMGNTSNTEFVKLMQAWVRTQPVLPIRQEAVVVDQHCPVYYVPATVQYCAETEVESDSNNNNSDDSDGLSHGAIAAIIVGVVLLLILLTVVIILTRRAYRKKGFER